MLGHFAKYKRAQAGQWVRSLVPHLSTCRTFADLLGLPPVPNFVDSWIQNTRAPITEAKALHPLFYTERDYTRVEAERIYGMNWFCIGHTAELPDSGDVKVVDVGDNSFIITRDKEGKLHAFINACRHRGARVCNESQKGCKQLVCPYHWWSYRLDGSLKSTPPAFMPKARKETLGLQTVNIDTFAGMIFLNLLDDAPPLSDQLGDLPRKLQRYDLHDCELHGTQDYGIAGNWKLIVENFVDFYHINAVHPALSKFSRVDDHRPYQGHGQYVGFVTTPLTDCNGPGDSHHFNKFPNLTPAEDTAALFFQIFPNVSLTIYPHSVYTLITFPQDESGKTKEQLTFLMAPGAKKVDTCADEYLEKKNALMDFVVNINDEDVIAIENLQRGLEGKKRGKASMISGEFLPEYDWPIHRFQNMILDGLDGAKIDESLLPPLDNEFEAQVNAHASQSA